MAWECVSQIKDANGVIYNLPICPVQSVIDYLGNTDEGVCTNSTVVTSDVDAPFAPMIDYTSGSITIANSIVLSVTVHGTQSSFYIDFSDGTILLSNESGAPYNTSNTLHMYAGILINHDSQYAKLFICVSSAYQTIESYRSSNNNTTAMQNLYNAVNSSIPQILSGGGGGLYGGYKGTSSSGGGAGSGYIGNSLLSNKKMIGYNVTTSSDTATKTETTDTYSAIREANKPKAGNGFAKITLIQAVNDNLLQWRTLTKDINHKKQVYLNPGINSLSEYFGTDWILSESQGSFNDFSSYDGITGIGRNRSGVSHTYTYIPIRPIIARNFKFKAKMNSTGYYAYIFMNLAYIDNNQLIRVLPDGSVGTYSNQWTECTKTLDEPKEVQYVVVEACDYIWNFTDFEFNYDDQE